MKICTPMADTIEIINRIAKIQDQPFEVLRILTEDGRFLLDAVNQDKIYRKKAVTIRRIYKKVLQKLPDTFKGIIVGYGTYSDPCKILKIMYDWMNIVDVIQKKSRFLGFCSSKSPCESDKCPMRTAVKWLEGALSYQLSKFNSKKDIFEKTQQRYCQLCKSKDLQADDFIFILNCNHIFCQDCFRRSSKNRPASLM